MRPSHPTPRACRAAGLAVALGLLGGCGPDLPPPVDAGEAGRQLDSALRAWKDGRPHAALAAGDPPVVFNEPLWRDGTRLLSYELGEVRLHGRQARCTAKLTLQGGNGRPGERSIGYQIDTVPRVVIVREGLGP